MSDVITVVTPPHNLDIEQEVIGALLLEDKLMEEVIHRVSPIDFYNTIHKDIYKAMSYLYHNNQLVDFTNVMDRLDFNKVKYDTDYVFNLTESTITSKSFEAKVDRLLDLSHKRGLYNVSKFMLTEDVKGVSMENIIKMFNGEIEKANLTSNVELIHTKTYASEWLEEFLKPLTHSKLQFGFHELDKLIMLEPTNLGVIAARPGIGKSAYALNITKNFCLSGKKVLFVSLEMSSKEVINRLVANMSGVEHEKIQRKKVLTPIEEENINKALEKIRGFNLQIYDKGSLTVDHLFNLAKKLHKQGLLDLVVLDYLQLMNSGKKSQNDHSDLGYITRRLKQLAQEIYIPILALSQLNRASADKNGKIREPQLTDLRQSGSIEEDANFVMMLHHEDTEDKYKEKHIKLFIRKNRSGSMGTINMNYIGDLVRFEEQVWNDRSKKFEKVKQEAWDKEFDINDEDLPF